MSFADNVLADGSTDNDNETSRFDNLVDTQAPNPDHTRNMVENSDTHKAEKVADLLEAFEAGRKDELINKYEAYRETVDFQRATGRKMDEAPYSNWDFQDTADDWDSYDETHPVDGAVLGPLYRWNKIRKETLRDGDDNGDFDGLKNEPGNLPAYKAVFPEPQVDELDLWIEMDEIGPNGQDAHIYCAPEVFENFGDCEGHIPPETVEEYKKQHTFERENPSDSEPEQEPANDSEPQQCAAIAATTGDRCKNDSQEGCKTCGHHDDETSDLVDTSHEVTTEKSGSDDNDEQPESEGDYPEDFTAAVEGTLKKLDNWDDDTLAVAVKTWENDNKMAALTVLESNL